MDLNKVISELDELFEQEKTNEIEGFLVSNIALAATEGARDAMLTLYNEIIGFYRETGQYDKSIENCHKAIALMDDMGLYGTIAYATTLLNVANAHRAAGLLNESLDYYNKVFPIYAKQLAPDDMYYASLYNNLSLLYQEMGNFAAARDQLENALGIVESKPDAVFEVAVTHANLANTCIELGEDEKAKKHALKAIEIFDSIGVDDAHYSAALSALGSLYFMEKDYENALSAMEKSRSCVEKYLGNSNIQYQRLTDNIKIIREKMVQRAAEENLEKMLEEEYEKIKEEVTAPDSAKAGETETAETNEQNKPDADIVESNTGEVTIKEADIEKTNIEESNIEESNIEESDIKESNTEETDIEESNIEKTNIEESDIEESGIKETGIAERDIKESNIKESDTEESNIGFSDIKEPYMTGMSLCRSYYEEYGAPMIAEQFGGYESRIAVGLVGKGSDCFGFDDELSADHDFGPRFVMWVTKEVYDAIGEDLQSAYEKLPDEYMGVKRRETFHGRDRAGVMVIEDFYKNVIENDLVRVLVQNDGNDTIDSLKLYLAAQDYNLAAATNGEVFRDDEGIFTSYRNMLLNYYPKAVWYRKLAQACALFSQSGQYNFGRMHKRGDMVACELAKAECAKQAMKLMYLINRRYAPHDKWLFKGMPENDSMKISYEDGDNEAENERLISDTSVSELVRRLCMLSAERDSDEIERIIETIAVIFANELEKKNIIGMSDVYLDANTNELTSKSDLLIAVTASKSDSIRALSLAIAKTEFEAFDKVHNEGGRASCQNNWPTFKIMRMSQYLTWDEDMLLQYLYEFKKNLSLGRNMIQEKYARMMKSTAPEKYAEFEATLPAISEEKERVIEEIVKVQVASMEQFAKVYPKLADNARLIHTSEDLEYDTSYETYLRGELGTYSDRMLEMYGRYVIGITMRGGNIAEEIMKNTVKFYGYESLEAANTLN